MKELQAQNTSVQRTLDDNLSTLNDVGIWRPQIDAKVNELHDSVLDLQQKVDQLANQPQLSDAAPRTFDTEYIDLTKPATAHLAATSHEVALGPLGHGATNVHRGTGNRVVTTTMPSPVKGANQFSAVPQSQFSLNHAMPPIDFPKFDDMSPKLCRNTVNPISISMLFLLTYGSN